ncbi:HEAT repeat domain-containing protein [Polaromonas sp. LjRoot131]|uniref:HEAT repeat domain-containing protein n=1 Tax=Polaromonas sp. LjRoot131 TaxID=3342262 RepID=UPI003ED0DE50
MNLNAWNEIVSGLSNPDVPTCVAAASKLYTDATPEDIPRLLSLLDSDDFFVREAAAGPLATLAGPAALPQLLKAYQRGFDEGHDNDGFSAALLEIPALFGPEATRAIAGFSQTAEQTLRDHALWLLEFCEKDDQPRSDRGE